MKSDQGIWAGRYLPVTSVRDVLAGEDVELGAETASAIGAGLAWTTLLAVGVAIWCLIAARRLASVMRRV